MTAAAGTLLSVGAAASDCGDRRDQMCLARLAAHACGDEAVGGRAVQELRLLGVQVGLLRTRVVWCGVVWCGVVWCGVVWCGVVWCGVVWCGGGRLVAPQSCVPAVLLPQLQPGCQPASLPGCQPGRQAASQPANPYASAVLLQEALGAATSPFLGVPGLVDAALHSEGRLPRPVEAIKALLVLGGCYMLHCLMSAWMLELVASSSNSSPAVYGTSSAAGNL
jgi:hypothetical protein